MPWKECNIMDERMRFVSRLLEGETMLALCREFNISRKTGYKILGRYRDCGLEGLNDRSRRPYRQANQLPTQVETEIVRLKKDLVAQAQASKKPPGKTSKQASTNKQQHDKLKQVANDKYGTDERFKGKFVEMAMKL